MRGIQSWQCRQAVRLHITPAHAGNTGCSRRPRRSLRDHPRACGEYRFHGPRCRSRPGITPAHAGNTRCRCRRLACTRDHPRACGEYQPGQVVVQPLQGSPPRMRGILLSMGYPSVSKGITPAHAGNTIGRLRRDGTAQDHPRACGEYLRKPTRLPSRRGSPPRMRGIPCRSALPWACIGITPAHAGNTSPVPCRSCRIGDHPRACGEYIHAFRTKRICQGSPPRMRGIRLHPQPFAHLNGDHPRACGEYIDSVTENTDGTGSPPRMRGIPQDLICTTLVHGITPAHAGNTRSNPVRLPVRRDHPRACGEYFPGRCRRGNRRDHPRACGEYLFR